MIYFCVFYDFGGCVVVVIGGYGGIGVVISVCLVVGGVQVVVWDQQYDLVLFYW